MSIKIILPILCLCCLALGIFYYGESQTVNQDEIKQENIENYLKTAQVGPEGWQEVGRRTESWIVGLDDGKIKQKGFFKVTDRPRPHMLPDSYKNEIAAYEIAKLLGLHIVPPVVEREINDKIGSLSLYLEGFIREDQRRRKDIEPPDSKRFKETLEEVRVFENLTYSRALCQQRALDDIFIMQEENWKIWRVDFSEAFAPLSELIPDCEITCCSRRLFQRLQKLDSNVVKNKLSPYLNDGEIGALLKRKGLIVEKIQKLIEEKGEDSVLF